MKTMTPARIQIVTSALHAYSLTLCAQYSKRVQRQSMRIAVVGRLFGFRMYTGMPTLGTIKNALRYARSVQVAAEQCVPTFTPRGWHNTTEGKAFFATVVA